SAGRTLPEMRTQHGSAPRALWRVHLVQRVPRVQVHQTEFYRREVPAVRRRRTFGEKGAPSRQQILWVLELSQVRGQLSLQASGGTLPAMRQSLSAGKAFEIRIDADLPEQQ